MSGRRFRALTAAALSATAVGAAWVVVAAPASADTTSVTLAAGKTLASGDQLSVGGYRLAMQTDGNLVEYHGSSVVWASGTYGQKGNHLAMQTDGNLVVYDTAGNWTWKSATDGHAGAHLSLQSDGNTVVYAGSTAVWAQSWRQSVSGAQAYARYRLAHYNWGSDQLSPLIDLWDHESSWRWDADNSSSGAYGIPQSLPGSKMGAAGPDWKTDGQTQVSWGLSYIAGRYGSPASAWAFWQQHGYY